MQLVAVFSLRPSVWKKPCPSRPCPTIRPLSRKSSELLSRNRSAPLRRRRHRRRPRPSRRRLLRPAPQARRRTGGRRRSGCEAPSPAGPSKRPAQLLGTRQTIRQTRQTETCGRLCACRSRNVVRCVIMFVRLKSYCQQVLVGSYGSWSAQVALLLRFRIV